MEKLGFLKKVKIMISEKDKEIIISYTRQFNVKEIYLFGSSRDNERDAHDIDLAARGYHLSGF